MVLRALFRLSDPKRFQSIFTTIFTLFTLLTLDDWSSIYLDSRAQGGTGPRLGGGQGLGGVGRPQWIGYPICKVGHLMCAGRGVTGQVKNSQLKRHPLSQVPGTSSPFS